jgi:glycosyltransferase involved in cell wall biosynthesis
MKHISVCVCTYKRPQSLKRLLDGLRGQQTSGLFAYSIVVADNDHLRSAEAVVSDFAAASNIPITYCVEPRQSIARARNMTVQNAIGDFVAFIDDDEVPERDWLLNLFKTCRQYHSDGVLGPVKPLFDGEPPRWVIKGKFCERLSHRTGTVVSGEDGRTGNALLDRRIFAVGEPPFNPEFHRGEDRRFFIRMIERGRVFIWCDEAVVHEVVPPSRWTRAFMLKRAMIRGAIWARRTRFRPREFAKSMTAVLAYAVALPFALMLGQHRFMNLLVRLCDHLGKLLGWAGIDPVGPYAID